MVATEQMLAGLAPAPRLERYPDHVKNAIGERNEDAIALRRPRSGGSVLDEFTMITGRRLAMLRAMDASEFDRLGPSPVGEVPYREFMAVRAFDCWIHEQDMRRALDIGGHLTGPVVTLVLERHRRVLGYIVGKKAQAPPGASVRFDVISADSPLIESVTIAVSGGRAAIADPPPGPADAVLTTDLGTYNALLCGRVGAERARATGMLSIDGDQVLGRAVAESMAYVF